MTFKFNLITDEGALGLHAYYQPFIDQNANGQDRYEAEAALGFLAWRNGDYEKMVDHFKSAALFVVDLLSQFNRLGAERKITQFVTPLLLAILFSTDEKRQQLNSIPQSSWFFPETSDFLPLAEYIQLINRIFISKTIDPVEVEKLIALNKSSGASQFYRPWIQFSCYALIMIEAGDTKNVEYQLNELLSLHERETEEGAWRKLVDGIVSLWALVIVEIADIFSLKIDYESPYIPNKKFKKNDA
jgi:hypothetical protein